MGTSGRVRPKDGQRPPRDGDGKNRGPRRRRREEFPDDEDFDVIPAAELEQTKNAMNLADLKSRPAAQLVELAHSMGLESLARSRKQDMIFSILKAHARNGEDIYGEGALEILQDGFGFLRSADSSYLARSRRYLCLTEPDSPPQPAYGRHRFGSDSSAEGQRALLRHAARGRDQP